MSSRDWKAFPIVMHELLPISTSAFTVTVLSLQIQAAMGHEQIYFRRTSYADGIAEHIAITSYRYADSGEIPRKANNEHAYRASAHGGRSREIQGDLLYPGSGDRP